MSNQKKKNPPVNKDKAKNKELVKKEEFRTMTDEECCQLLSIIEPNWGRQDFLD